MITDVLLQRLEQRATILTAELEKSRKEVIALHQENHLLKKTQNEWVKKMESLLSLLEGVDSQNNHKESSREMEVGIESSMV